MQNRTYVVIANYDSENRLIRYIGYSDKECTREAFYITTSGSVAYDTEITQGGLNYIELQLHSENTGPLIRLMPSRDAINVVHSKILTITFPT